MPDYIPNLLLTSRERAGKQGSGGKPVCIIAATPARGDMYKARTSETNPRLFYFPVIFSRKPHTLCACSPSHLP